MKNRKIRVVVLGDEAVGKTQWISSLVSMNNGETVEKVIGPVVLPPELCVQSYDLSTVLIDTSSDPAQASQVSDEIKDANVILLFYDITRSDTIKRMETYWMPLINQISSKIPVIIIGNKIDLFDDIRNNDSIDQYNKVHKVIIPLIKKYNQVEMGLECSAIFKPNIKDIIYCSQRAVLFPLAPLYDLQQKQLKPEFVRALTRIFRICDKDLDGVWHDSELIDFQLEVFRGELTKQDIKGIKEIIKEEVSRDSQDQGITLDGFLTLQKRCVELIKIQICWTILRHFGYDDKLQLKAELFKDELIYDKESGQTVELGDISIEFLKNIFNRFQNNRLISIDQFDDIFLPINKIPWKNIDRIVTITKLKNTINEQEEDKQYLTLDSWLNLWHYLTLKNYKKTFKYLTYIGYQQSLLDTFEVTNKKNCYSQIMKMNTRNVFHICLIGNPKSGKTQMLQTLIHNQFSDIHTPTNQSRSIIVTQNTVAGRKRTFIFTEVPASEIVDYFGFENCQTIDFVGLVYDSEHKVKQFLEEHEHMIPPYIPRFIIKSKCDNSLISDKFIIPQFLKVFSTEYCECSSKDLNVGINLNLTLTNLIDKPTLGLSEGVVKYLKDHDSFFRRRGDIIILGLAAATVFGLLYVITSNKPGGGVFGVINRFFRKKHY